MRAVLWESCHLQSDGVSQGWSFHAWWKLSLIPTNSSISLLVVVAAPKQPLWLVDLFLYPTLV